MGQDGICMNMKIVNLIIDILFVAINGKNVRV